MDLLFTKVFVLRYMWVNTKNPNILGNWSGKIVESRPIFLVGSQARNYNAGQELSGLNWKTAKIC